MKKILVATTNYGKVREYREIFKQLELPVRLVSLKDLGIKSKAKEDGKTFKENAIKKSDFYCKLTGLPTIADDGGLEIDYLNGEPGIKSRRWPGYEASDKELISLVLEKLKGVPIGKRTAKLKIILALSVPNQRTFTFEEKMDGVIAKEPLPKIIPGYPFRSIFYLPDAKMMFGELSFGEEVKIGHRRKAVERAVPIIKKFILDA
jgi:XTP/dITP diphosphohydrolase